MTKGRQRSANQRKFYYIESSTPSLSDYRITSPKSARACEQRKPFVIHIISFAMSTALGIHTQQSSQEMKSTGRPRDTHRRRDRPLVMLHVPPATQCRNVRRVLKITSIHCDYHFNPVLCCATPFLPSQNMQSVVYASSTALRLSLAVRLLRASERIRDLQIITQVRAVFSHACRTLHMCHSTLH